MEDIWSNVLNRNSSGTLMSHEVALALVPSVATPAPSIQRSLRCSAQALRKRVICGRKRIWPDVRTRLGGLVRCNGLADLMGLRFSEIVHGVVGAVAEVAVILAGETVTFHVSFLSACRIYDMRSCPKVPFRQPQRLLFKAIGNDKRTT
jgi:hypothetical protein